MPATANDPFDLERFTKAQEGIYPRALSELKAGEKRSHWMWFIFPQIDGLGRSSMAIQYAIKSMDEARAYLAHPTLGKRLKECAEAVLAVQGRSASAIMGYPDDMKLKSSMTLFEKAAGDADPVFGQVLDKYYGKERDHVTLSILERLKTSR